MNLKKNKKTILVITGTRAEYGLLRPIIREIKKSKKLSLRLLVTGAHTLKKYGYTLDEIYRDKIPVSHVVPVRSSDSMLGSFAKEIRGISLYCEKEKPDLILVLGDRDESFAGAIVGGHLGIPVAHIHGGDKTGYIVDEYIRHATTKFSHLHFAATKLSAERIRLLGEEPSRIFIVGAPGLDEMRSLKLTPRKEVALKYGLNSNETWFMIVYHPTPLDPASYQEQVRPLLSAISGLTGEKVIIYPNSDTGSDIFIKEISKYKKNPSVHIIKNLPRVDFLSMLKNSSLLLGNSSIGIIESSYFRIPTVNIGNRQRGRERGANTIECTYNFKSINRAIKRAMSAQFKKLCDGVKSPYDQGGSAKIIVGLLEKNICRKDLFYKKLTYR